jgi:hypothetical protein
MTRNSPGRFLFVLRDGGGTVPPELALARRVAAAGHQVRILAPRSLQGKVEGAGCSFLPYRRSPDRDPRQPTAEGRAGSPAATVISASRPYADDVQEALDAMPADVIAADYILFGACSHDLSAPGPRTAPFRIRVSPRTGASRAGERRAGRFDSPTPLEPESAGAEHDAPPLRSASGQVDHEPGAALPAAAHPQQPGFRPAGNTARQCRVLWASA